MTRRPTDNANGSDLYRSLAHHQQDPCWNGHPDFADSEMRTQVFAELHRWVEIFCFEFKLQIPNIALAVSRLRSRDGQFRDCNGFGLQREIILDTTHLATGNQYDVLGTLLHELLHAWQYLHGRSGRHNYHNKQFQRKAESLGLLIDRYGHQDLIDSPTPFTELLKKHGVTFPKVFPRHQMVASHLHSSKLKLWTCRCGQKARVGRAEFFAVCSICHHSFERCRN